MTIFFGSRGINAVHKDKIDKLVCLPDQPREVQEAVVKKSEDDLVLGVTVADPATYYKEVMMAADINLAF